MATSSQKRWEKYRKWQQATKKWFKKYAGSGNKQPRNGSKGTEKGNKQSRNGSKGTESGV